MKKLIVLLVGFFCVTFSANVDGMYSGKSHCRQIIIHSKCKRNTYPTKASSIRALMTPKVITSTSEKGTMVEEVIRLVNVERKTNGLGELSIDRIVSQVAQEKCKDMRTKNYFSHQSPTYGSPWNMLQSYHVSFKAAAENIAAGSRTAEDVMKQWMNSSGHRKNILNPSFSHIGVGYTEGGSWGSYWTQIFIKK